MAVENDTESIILVIHFKLKDISSVHYQSTGALQNGIYCFVKYLKNNKILTQPTCMFFFYRERLLQTSPPGGSSKSKLN